MTNKFPRRLMVHTYLSNSNKTEFINATEFKSHN